jgi:hypothetical protein
MNSLSWRKNAWFASKNKTPPPPPPGNQASDGEWVAYAFTGTGSKGPAFVTQWIWMPMPDHTLVTVVGPNGATAPSMSLLTPVMLDAFPSSYPVLTSQTRWNSNTNAVLSLAASAKVFPPGKKIDPPAPALVVSSTPKGVTGPSADPGSPAINTVLNNAGASNLVGAQWYSALPAYGRSGFPAGQAMISLRSLPGQPVSTDTDVTQPPSGAVTAANAAASPSALTPAGPNLLLIGLGGLIVLGLGTWALYEIV